MQTSTQGVALWVSHNSSSNSLQDVGTPQAGFFFLTVPCTRYTLISFTGRELVRFFYGNPYHRRNVLVAGTRRDRCRCWTSWNCRMKPSTSTSRAPKMLSRPSKPWWWGGGMSVVCVVGWWHWNIRGERKKKKGNQNQFRARIYRCSVSDSVWAVCRNILLQSKEMKGNAWYDGTILLQSKELNWRKM